MYDSTAVTNRSTLEKFFLSLPKTSQKVRTLNLHFKVRASRDFFKERSVVWSHQPCTFYRLTCGDFNDFETLKGATQTVLG